VDEPRSLNEFPRVVKTYIRYEEKLYDDSLNKTKKKDTQAETSKKSLQEKKKEGKPLHEGNGPIGCFTEYTPLAVLRTRLFLLSLLQISKNSTIQRQQHRRLVHTKADIVAFTSVKII
jgi:hypothetical protein